MNYLRALKTKTFLHNRSEILSARAENRKKNCLSRQFQRIASMNPRTANTASAIQKRMTTDFSGIPFKRNE